MAIENEIDFIHNFIHDKYRLKFLELESLLLHLIDYARMVKKIGNEMTLFCVDLEGVFPSHMIMLTFVTAASASGKPAPEKVLQNN